MRVSLLELQDPHHAELALNGATARLARLITWQDRTAEELRLRSIARELGAG